MLSRKGDGPAAAAGAQFAQQVLRPAASRHGVPLHAWCALVAASLALLALAGHLLGFPVLSRFLPERAALSPMTGLCILVGAAALTMLHPARARALQLASLQVAMGVATMAAHAADIPERGLVPLSWWSSPLTGAGLASSGAATVALALGRVHPGQVLAFIMLMLSILFGLGHVFPEADLYRFLPGTGVAIPTVLSFIALSLGQLLSFSDRGATAALSPRNTAGRAGLRLLLAGAIAALAVMAAVVASFRYGAFDAETAVLLVAWASLALLGASLWALAVAVHRAELSREAAESERQQLRQLVVAALTHDLRSPLQAASMSAIVLQRLVSDPGAAAAVGRLQRSHRRLERLLRSLLDSLVLDGGQQLALQPAPISLDALVRDVVEENDAALRDRVDVQGDAAGWWDPDALFRVMENLLLNAVKYGAHGTPIRIRIAPHPDQVVVTVTNEGQPIPDAEWESIFLPFSRAQSAREGQQVGWGVGLSYARSVIAGHGGQIRVASSSDMDGTTFEVTLPIDARRAAA
jgi:signal transduction histidine kinase